MKLCYRKFSDLSKIWEVTYAFVFVSFSEIGDIRRFKNAQKLARYIV